MDTETLFTANTIILWVMALALAVAGWGRRHEPWWESWVLANLVLGVALVVFIVEGSLPTLLVATLPNGLLVLGFAFRLRAAREFGGRSAPASIVWAPLVVLTVFAAPLASVSYGAVFTLTNLLLTILAAAVVWEFWRDRADGLPSRYGLVVAYGAIGASFGWRMFLGIFDAGAMPPRLPQDTALVVHLAIALFHTVASGAFALSIAYERGNAQLRHAASHDALTGLLNRGAFETQLRARLEDRKSKPFALALLDIDHFKQINDRHGHAAGDGALRQCATTCRQVAGGQSVVARVGGEEFAIILDAEDEAKAMTLIDRLRGAVGTSPVTYAGRRFRVTVSGGVCHSSAAPCDFDEMMRLADLALYKAKDKGRNRIHKAA